MDYLDEKSLGNARFAILRGRSYVDAVAQDRGAYRQGNRRRQDRHSYPVDLAGAHHSTRHDEVSPNKNSRDQLGSNRIGQDHYVALPKTSTSKFYRFVYT